MTTESRQKNPAQFRAWNTPRPVCVKCGKVVAGPKEVNGVLRGHCPEHGRVDVEWIERPKGGQ